MSVQRSIKPGGNLSFEVVRYGTVSETRDFWRKIRNGFPQSGLLDEVNRWRLSNLPHLWRGLRRVMLARLQNSTHFYGGLNIVVVRGEERLHYGTGSLRVVTDAGVDAIVDAFQNTVELENFRFHGLGTDNTAEAVGDTALVTELTTEYAVDNTRPTGTLTEGGSSNVFRTVATNTLDGAAAVVEFGVLSQAATGGGTLLDRSVFAVVSLSASDSFESTFDLTLPSGG